MPFSRYTLRRNEKGLMETLEMVCGRRRRTILRCLIEDIKNLTFGLVQGMRPPYATSTHFVLAIATIPELVLTNQTP